MGMRKIEHHLISKNPLKKIGVCSKDGEVKIVKSRAYKGRFYWHCYVGNRERLKLWKQKQRQIKKNLLNTSCDICGRSPKKLCWDHNHETGVFRGTLCNRCNMVLGLLHDDPQIAVNIHKYLTSR